MVEWVSLNIQSCPKQSMMASRVPMKSCRKRTGFWLLYPVNLERWPPFKISTSSMSFFDVWTSTQSWTGSIIGNRSRIVGSASYINSFNKDPSTEFHNRNRLKEAWNVTKPGSPEWRNTTKVEAEMSWSDLMEISSAAHEPYGFAILKEHNHILSIGPTSHRILRQPKQ